jgi:DNA polymerase-3 subunit beta
MSFTVDKKAFTAALERCTKVAHSKSTIPILSHVVLISDGVELSYRVTNLAITLSGSIDCSGLSASFTVNVRDLLAAASSVIGDKVKLTEKDGRLTVSGSGKRSFKIPTLSATDFPVTKPGSEDWFTLPAKLLRDTIEKVLFAVAPETDERPNLRSIRLRIGDGELNVAGTNGHCAAIAKSPFESSAKVESLIPRGAIASVMAFGTDTIDMSATVANVCFRSGRETLIAETIASEFPAVDGALAGITPSQRVNVSSPLVLETIAAIRKGSSAKDIVLSFEDGSMKFECFGESSAVDTIECDATESAELALAAEYLMGALRSCDTAELGICPGEFDPFLVTGSGVVCALMPVRLEAAKSITR